MSLWILGSIDASSGYVVQKPSSSPVVHASSKMHQRGIGLKDASPTLKLEKHSHRDQH